MMRAAKSFLFLADEIA